MRQLQVVWVFKLQPKLKLTSLYWSLVPEGCTNSGQLRDLRSVVEGAWTFLGYILGRDAYSMSKGLQTNTPPISHHWFEIRTSTGRLNIMRLYLGECVRISRKSTVLLALALLEPLVLIPDPMPMYNSRLYRHWIWDQWEGVLIPDSLTGHGPFCFVVGQTLRTSLELF